MLLVYSLKVALCLAAFYLVFKLLLSRDTYHRFNRVALLSLVVGALLVPFVQLSTSHPGTLLQSMQAVETIIAEGTTADGAHDGVAMTAARLLVGAYVLGIVLMLLRTAVSYAQLVRLLRSGTADESFEEARLIVMKQDIKPFSWFGYIVISERDYQEHPREILLHELAHVHSLHSLDVLLCDVLIVFQWFNPAAWLVKRELQAIHEYEADRAVLCQGVDARSYQLLLVRKAVGDQLFFMANNLNQSALASRIRMMNVAPTGRWQRLKLLAVVPVAALAVAAFAHPRMETTAARIASAAEMSTGWQQDDDAPIYDIVERMPDFPGGNAFFMDYLQRHIHYPEQAKEQGIEGRVVLQMVIESDGYVSHVKVVRSVHPLLDEEAVRVVGSTPRWNPGWQGGQRVRCRFTVPIVFRLP